MNTVIAPSETTEALFSAGTHYGVAKARRHPSVQSALFGQKNKVDLFDLAYTEAKLADATDFVRELGHERKLMLFLGGKAESHKVIREASSRVGAAYVIGRWIGGTITNFSEIRKRVLRMVDLTAQREAGALNKYTKFERLQIDREIEKLESMFGGLISLGENLPQALFVVDPKREAIAVREARAHGIKVIALANSDCNFKDVDFVIPGNDAALKSISYVVNRIADAYKEGRDAKLVVAPATVA